MEAKHDVLVVGAGCAGMRAAIEALRRGRGRGADLEDPPDAQPLRRGRGRDQRRARERVRGQPEIHAFDTVKGSDYLGDQDAIQILCDEAPGDVYQLEHWGAVFSRTEDGRIAQRPFGAAGAPRTAYAADITGHVLIQVLYEQVMQARHSRSYEEFFALAARRERRTAARASSAGTSLDGGLKTIGAKTVILATGGAGRLYVGTTNAYSCTGDGMAHGAATSGVALEGHGDDAVPSDDARADRRAHHRGLPRRGRVPRQLRTASAS